LTPDSIKQNYAQTVVSMRIVPGCVQFLGEEKRFYTAWVICVDIGLFASRPVMGDLGSGGYESTPKIGFCALTFFLG
jgi:hypothetical protein